MQAETSLRKSKETVAKVLRGFCKDKEKELKEIREEIVAKKLLCKKTGYT